MSHLETIHLAHLPPQLAIHIAMFRDLKNGPFLREQLISQNSEYEYAFIDASMILSRKHLLAAIFRATNDYVHKRIKSNNVHSEIVFSLSPNNNMAESFRRFGITDSTKDLLAIKVSTSPEITSDSVSQHLEKAVDATPVPFDSTTLSNISNLTKIKKAYKLSGLTGAKLPRTAEDSQVDPVDAKLYNQLELSILGYIALRSVA